MTNISDGPNRYGLVTRIFHWGMAVLFAAQFVSAAAHWALPRENALRDTLFSYHANLGTTLFLLVLLRGIWGLINIKRRPPHAGTLGRADVVGHVALYTFMVIIPAVRLLASFGGTRGFSYFGLSIVPARETAIAWTQIAAEWHGEMGWILALLVLGHIAMATVWHRLIQRDGVLTRMT